MEPRIFLRPSVTNKTLWYPNRPSKSEWDRLRRLVLDRDNHMCASCGHRALKWMNIHHLSDSGDNSPENLVLVCVACHAVLHVGLNLMHGGLEIWESDLPQVEIVRQTRAGVRAGETLAAINARFPRRPGPLPARSTGYANTLLSRMASAARAELEEPLCAFFVKFSKWQLEDEQA